MTMRIRMKPKRHGDCSRTETDVPRLLRMTHCGGRGAMRGLLLLFLTFALTTQAQRAPQLGYVYPAGGRQGATSQVVIGGQFLGGATGAFVSGEGIRAIVTEVAKPMNQGQFNQLRDQLRALQERKLDVERAAKRGAATTNVWTAADEKQLAEIREKIIQNPPNRNVAPALAETVTLRVTIAEDAAPGTREIRLVTPGGLSNPLVFQVGQLPEFSEPAARAANPDLDRFLERLGRPPAPNPTRSEMRIRLPATVNGQIMPGTVDRFRFHARRGQQLVARVQARALIPYLADAVPGWFQATLALQDAQGRELVYVDDFRFDPDPALHFEIPRNGEYILEIKDAIYRGREDFVYRLTVGELPLVTGIFPLGGPVGATTEVELTGWNLPTTRVTVDNRDTTPGVRTLSGPWESWAANPVLFAVDALPELTATAGHHELRTAQVVSLPVIINGRIGQPGGTDVFRFEGRAGEELVAEVMARRLNSPLDSRLQLTDAAGKQIAANDDCEDKGAGLVTHHADSYLRATLPADGLYYVQITDAPRRGGPEYTYRLRLSAPRPDFALRAVPSSLSVRAGSSAPVTVFALRKDGFTNAIAVALKKAPPGFKLSGGEIPAGAEQIKLTVTAPWFGPEDPAALELEGRATVAGQELVRLVLPADDQMQAFFYRHLVPARELRVAVSRGFGRGRGLKLLSDVPVKIPAGGTAVVRLDAPARAFANPLRLELTDPPPGISLGKIASAQGGTELTLRADAGKAAPGTKGNLIVTATLARPAAAKGKAAATARQSVATLPAIPFEIVARTK